MVLLYPNKNIFLYGFNHKLGSIRRDLNQLQIEGLLLGSSEALSALGYQYNFGIGKNETLLSLATDPLSRALQSAREPRTLVFQHCYAESAVLHYEANETDVATRNRYFPGELMRELQLDHLPYFCSFASGCAGFVSLLVVAGGVSTASRERGPTICVMADCMPQGVPNNMLQERILGSDHSSAFLVGHAEVGYQLLGVNYYSTTPPAVSFVEIVKLTVKLIQQLTTHLKLDLAPSGVAIHYPNISRTPGEW